MDLNIERELAIMVTWAMFSSSLFQALVHWMTLFVLRRQQSQTEVGKALNDRELTLAVKGMSRTGVDLLLAVLVTWNRWLVGMEMREALYVATTLSAIAAIIYGIRYVLALRKENFGRPDRIEGESDGTQSI